MTRAQVEARVTEEREALLEGKESVADAVIAKPNRGHTVALGLLALDVVADAKTWFDALAEEWIIYADNKYDAKYQSEPRRSAQLGPWDDYINALYSVILSRGDVETTAETVLERATKPFVDELENRALAHRIDLARSLSSHLVDNGTVGEHVTALEDRVRDRDDPWAVDRYLPYARTLRGLEAGDATEVSAGIEGLLDFHRDRVASARDADAVQQAVALDATTILALARREGMDLTVDHDAIPDAVNDDEHYPVDQ